MTWICKPTAGHEKHGQSVVYDEDTGRNIAIVYDGATDGQKIAAAPELLEACKSAKALAEEWLEFPERRNPMHLVAIYDNASAAIAKSEGNCP